MLRSAHLDSIPVASSSLTAAARGRLGVEVLSCPGWCMADLVWHTAFALHSGAAIVRAQAAGGGEGTAATPDTPPDEQLLDWLEAGSADIVSALGKHDSDDTLGRPLTEMGFPGPSLHQHYAREVGVHRWDAENAIGTPSPLDDELTTDWLDGILRVWLPAASRRGNQAQGPWAGESIHFQCTDGDAEWTICLDGPGSVTIHDGLLTADVSIRGRSADLLLLAMNRSPVEDARLEVVGDRAVMKRWAEEIRYGRPASGAHWFGSPRPGAGRGSRSVRS